MSKAMEERVEVSAIKSDYQFGFHDPDKSVFEHNALWADSYC